jgi:hypothetical protein
MKNKVIVQSGQTLFDIALQEYGSIAGVFQLADDNGIDNITDELAVGSVLIVSDEFIVNKNIVDFYKNNRITSATALSNNQLQGIGFWAIGVDFIIN